MKKSTYFTTVSGLGIGLLLEMKTNTFNSAFHWQFILLLFLGVIFCRIGYSICK